MLIAQSAPACIPEIKNDGRRLATPRPSVTRLLAKRFGLTPPVAELLSELAGLGPKGDR